MKVDDNKNKKMKEKTIGTHKKTKKSVVKKKFE